MLHILYDSLKQLKVNEKKLSDYSKEGSEKHYLISYQMVLQLKGQAVLLSLLSQKCDHWKQQMSNVSKEKGSFSKYAFMANKKVLVHKHINIIIRKPIA